MDHSKYYKELTLFHEMFSKEHDQAVSNLKNYNKLVNITLFINLHYLML